MSFWVEFWNNLTDTSLLEAVSVVLGLIYVVLAAKEKMLCWVFAFVGSCTAIKISFDANLYVDCVLNFIYAVMAVIGWLEWKRKDVSTSAGTKKASKPAIQLKFWKLPFHLLGLIGIGICGLLTGYFLDKFTDQAFPYVDSWVFFASILATWMITQKIIENWIYLAIVDFICIFLYYNRGYAMVCVLFVLYTFLALWGFYEWRRKLKVEAR